LAQIPLESPRVHGLNLDPETRCAHYHQPTDIIAIKMRCCGEFYACKVCHDALADHSLEPWPQSEWQAPAILCGACKTTLTIAAYLNCESSCPHCSAAFNPACRNHYHYYFSEAPSA